MIDVIKTNISVLLANIVIKGFELLKYQPRILLTMVPGQGVKLRY